MTATRTPLGDERDHPAPCRTCRRPTWNLTDCNACVRARTEPDAGAAEDDQAPPAATSREGCERGTAPDREARGGAMPGRFGVYRTPAPYHPPTTYCYNLHRGDTDG